MYSEGKKTEPLYFKAYELAISSAVIEVVCERERGDPKRLLTLAEKKRNEINGRAYQRLNGSADKVWVAFDRDDHDDIPQVISQCGKLDIGVAYSNPCFEVWLILHKENYDRDEHRDLTQRKCEEVCDGYSKDSGKFPDFSKILNNVEAAEDRAEKLLKRRSEDNSPSPFTTVHLLTQEMRAGK